MAAATKRGSVGAIPVFALTPAGSVIRVGLQVQWAVWEQELLRRCGADGTVYCCVLVPLLSPLEIPGHINSTAHGERLFIRDFF